MGFMYRLAFDASYNWGDFVHDFAWLFVSVIGGKFSDIYNALIGKTNISSTIVMAMRDGSLSWSEAVDIGQSIFALVMNFTPYASLWSTIDLVISASKLM